MGSWSARGNHELGEEVRHILHTALVSIAIIGTALPATATSRGDDDRARAAVLLEERIVTLEARVDTLERLILDQAELLTGALTELARLQPAQEAAESETAVATRATGPTTSTGAGRPAPQGASSLAGWTSSHPYINSASGDFTMQFSGRVHLDYRGYSDKNTPGSTFVLRRARLTAEGRLFQNYGYRVETDFSDRSGAILRDAYIDAHFTDAFELRFGQFKAPFSQERLNSSNRINFVDRSSVVELSPGRSPGIMVHGSLSDAVEYGFSASNGQGILDSNDTPTPEVVGQLRLTPLPDSELFGGLRFGGAYGHGRSDHGSSFRGRTASRSVTFFSSVPINGKVTRANAEFQWLYRGFALRSEYDQANQWREGLADGGGNLPGVVSKGYTVDTSYVIGGDMQPNTSIIPRTTFLQDGGTGAVQFVFRYENLQIDDLASANRGEAYTVGVNWWLSRFIRYQSNVAFERFQHPDRTGLFNRRSTITFLGRMQVMF